jgi:mitotic spindle assembly checkpoint protein MAD2B
MAPGGGPSGAGGARARSQSDLRLDVITEFLEAATHHTLHARGVYPKELFEARAFYGARVQKSRHPDLDAYVADAVQALRGPIARGDVRRVVLVIKDGDSGGAGEPLERHVFDFALRDDYLSKTPSAEDVDALAKAFAACMSKISFLDAVLPPIPTSAMTNGLTFELVAYADKPGIVRELGVDQWSEERVADCKDAGEEQNAADERMRAEPRMEFWAGNLFGRDKETYPVKTTKTNLIDIDVFVERRGEDTTKNGGSRVDR